jgi:putative transcriptional regulator
LSENAVVSIKNATGKLLVATPQTGGEVFRRSVVLVLQHDEEGAQGVVLNRPLQASVSAVLPPWQDYVTAPPKVFRGGPVALDSALGLVTVPGDKEEEPMGVRLLFGGIGLVDLDIPPLVVMPEVAGLRIFAGYAGWSGGQLEQEISEGGWYVVDSEARDAFTSEPETLWSRVLRRQRGNLAFVASFPEDPGMN